MGKQFCCVDIALRTSNMGRIFVLDQILLMLRGQSGFMPSIELEFGARFRDCALLMRQTGQDRVWPDFREFF